MGTNIAIKLAIEAFEPGSGLALVFYSTVLE
jgi:hypothetical protein